MANTYKVGERAHVKRECYSLFAGKRGEVVNVEVVDRTWPGDTRPLRQRLVVVYSLRFRLGGEVYRFDAKDITPRRSR